jgi:hypothetical protein
MSYNVTIMRMSNDNLRVQIKATGDFALFDMEPGEARQFAFRVIEVANEIDQANAATVIYQGEAGTREAR